MKKKIILIDGSFYLYRAYYALPNLINNKGYPTGAIYGFINMFNKIIKMNINSYFLIIFDAKGISFRKKIFSKYKSTRINMPVNLIIQIKPLFKIIQAMGYNVISIKNIEADDIIGTLSLQAEKKNYFVFIFSIDKDIAQLVTQNIKIVNPINYSISGPKEIYKKYGVYPKFISDLLALSGDPIDNIPGVPGIGNRIGQNLINKLGDLKYIYKNINYIDNINFRGGNNIKKKLLKYKKLVFLYHKLTKIKTNILINIDNLNLKMKTQKKNLKYLFKLYKFNKWIKNFHC
ncbi:5'-3' exonuclease [Enterobacteriaceae endosymbiont of Donacia sparganii]|uniref:5'-3' exonuclease n=1 Tax=Enterobacteriaceae endosymbiont of Donacia sparganii TaxID=2675785 RepID=UPI00144991CE|nr:5'-3' exonuclease H3TH domain-containing protein [Enterobacteriaceae endosymbiont of Donacia sparganii]QJC35853.1 flap endonuclease [Enterobacteriaceae endosymbiont of Donacia sparganii]